MSDGINAKTQRRKDETISRRVHARVRGVALQTRPWLINLLHSFGFAFAGIAAMLRTQRNAQIHTAITCAVIIAGFALRVSPGEWIALVLSITMVLALEAINTAIEAVVDLVSPQQHPLAKKAKDVAAGAVLLAAIGTATVACIVFLPKLIALIP